MTTSCTSVKWIIALFRLSSLKRRYVIIYKYEKTYTNKSVSFKSDNKNTCSCNILFQRNQERYIESFCYFLHIKYI